MDPFLIIANLFVFLILLFVLFRMQKKHVSFSKRVFAGLGLGLLFGFILHLIYGTESEVTTGTIDWLNIVGTGYVKLLQMVVMPLVFISIVGAFTKLKITKNLGKISALVIGILLFTTGISAVIGIGTTLSFGLDQTQIVEGEAERARNESLADRVETAENITIPQQMLEMIPSNPFADLTGSRPTSTIAVVIFAAFIGVAFLGVKRKHSDEADVFAKLIDSIYLIVMRIVTLVLRLTPYGILALMAKVAATSNYDAVVSLGKFIIANYVAIILMFMVHLLLLALAKLNPIHFLKKAMPPLTFAFTSRSSAGTLPINIKSQVDDLGVSEGVANFAGPFGLSIGQNGCAGIYPAMLAVMAAPAVGIDPTSISFLLTLIVVIIISSFGVAGVGGGATFASLIVLSVMDLPVAIVGLMVTIEPLIDMGRTALNVSGSMVAGVLTSKINGDLKEEVYRRPEILEAK
ncbi:L-cystine transporter [Niallia sp. XMNu-256]|uniref:L-cystine transporter n=1 Tax=Niallia sp. XMNu-256 TaxID=3082444 RepID=UPI0030CF0958